MTLLQFVSYSELLYYPLITFGFISVIRMHSWRIIIITDMKVTKKVTSGPEETAQ